MSVSGNKVAPVKKLPLVVVVVLLVWSTLVPPRWISTFGQSELMRNCSSSVTAVYSLIAAETSWSDVGGLDMPTSYCIVMSHWLEFEGVFCKILGGRQDSIHETYDVDGMSPFKSGTCMQCRHNGSFDLSGHWALPQRTNSRARMRLASTLVWPEMLMIGLVNPTRKTIDRHSISFFISFHLSLVLNKYSDKFTGLCKFAVLMEWRYISYEKDLGPGLLTCGTKSMYKPRFSILLLFEKTKIVSTGSFKLATLWSISSIKRHMFFNHLSLVHCSKYKSSVKLCIEILITCVSSLYGKIHTTQLWCSVGNTKLSSTHLANMWSCSVNNTFVRANARLDPVAPFGNSWLHRAV